jgi:hypothetical protein
MSSSAAASKPARKPAAKKSDATTTSVPVEVAAPAPAPVAAPAVISHVEAPAAAVPASTVDEGASLVSEYNALVEKVNALRNAVNAIVTDTKSLGRRVARVAKKADKRRGRKAAVEGGAAKPKKDGVFTRPNKITDELCVFLGKPKGTEMARSEVTRAVIAYCKTKSLMEGQNIKTTDAGLRKLLRLTEHSTLSILTLQTHLKQHYIKAAPVAPAAGAASTPATKA